MRTVGPTSAAALRAVLVIAMFGALAEPAAAAATGVIEGRVVNQTTGSAQAGVELILTSGTEDGRSRVVATATSDDRGRYRFEELTTGEDRFYALDARFDGGLFAGRPLTLPSNTSKPPVVSSTMRVWNTTSDPAVMVVARDDLFVVADDTGVGVIESVTVTNTSEQAYIGRGAALTGDGSSGASVAFALASGATDLSLFESDLDMPEVIPVESGFATTVAFPPGDTRTTFSYRIEGAGGSFDLSRPALYPTLELSIYSAPPLEIRSNRLEAREPVTIDGRRYERWSAAEPIDAGDPLQALAVANATLSLIPIIAIGAAALVLGTTGTIAMRRRRPRRPQPEPLPDRARLLEEVARLDLDYEAGDIDQAGWDDRRSTLMGRLRELERSDR